MTDTPKQKNTLTQVVAGPFVISYPHIQTAQEAEKDETGQKKGSDKFGGAFIALAETKIDALQAAVIAAAQAKFPGKDVAAMFKFDTDGNRELRSPFRTDLEKKGYSSIPGVGKWYFSARSNTRPGLCLADKSLVSLEDIPKYFYAGARVKVHVNAYWYGKKGNTGISFGLNNLQFLSHGERIDSRISADDAFTVEVTEAGSGDLEGLLAATGQ